MHLLYVGITHKQSSIAFLERVHFSDEQQLEALLKLKDEKSVLENVIVSTCNRTELYLVVDQLHTGRYYAKRFLADWFGISAEELAPYLTVREGDLVLDHLLRVAIGLESKILGETQILGQLKRAFLKAQTAGVTGIVLNEVFKRVITFAKRMHDQYRINARPISIGLTAMQTLNHIGFEASGKTIAIIGLGEIGQLVTKYALKEDFAKISLINRTVTKADPFLSDKRVTAYAWDDLELAVSTADVVVSAVKVGGYIVFPGMLKPDAIVFDLCLPRTVHANEDMILYNIENLTNQLDTYHTERQEIAGQMIREISDELLAFDEWRRQLGIVPLIRELRERAITIQESALASLHRKLPDLTPREQKQIAKHMKGIVNQLIKEPILQLKELSIDEGSTHDIALICKLFGINQEKVGYPDDRD